MKIKESFFSSHGIRATFLASPFRPLFRQTFSAGDPLRQTFSGGSSLSDLLRHTFFVGPSPQTFSIGPFFSDFSAVYFFPRVYLQSLFRLHQLVVQSILTTHLMFVSHSNHINSSCSQVRRLFQRTQIYPLD